MSDAIRRQFALSRLNARLDALLDLDDGWLDGEGEAPTGLAIKSARRVLTAAIESGADRPRIYPTPDGNVSAEWVIGDWGADAEFDGGAFEICAINAKTHEDRGEVFKADGCGGVELAAWLKGLA